MNIILMRTHASAAVRREVILSATGSLPAGTVEQSANNGKTNAHYLRSLADRKERSSNAWLHGSKFRFRLTLNTVNTFAN